MSAPWKCPECRAWIAPHVSEHRCDPPAAGVTVTPFAPSGGSGTTGGTLPWPGTTITVTASGASVSQQELTRTIQDGMLRLAARNASIRWGLPGQAA